eukprot:GEMP01028508.1.p1 GENE.GEMP01028508.1~~GEMP01028508.1.p1  ORF type:complete len:145 (+),score=11.75 GEMP01028508.1:36-437(+)
MQFYSTIGTDPHGAKLDIFDNVQMIDDSTQWNETEVCRDYCGLCCIGRADKASILAENKKEFVVKGATKREQKLFANDKSNKSAGQMTIPLEDGAPRSDSGGFVKQRSNSLVSTQATVELLLGDGIEQHPWRY